LAPDVNKLWITVRNLLKNKGDLRQLIFRRERFQRLRLSAGAYGAGKAIRTSKSCGVLLAGFLFKFLPANEKTRH
ncbi:hypothetical protein, partial [Mesorhizobium sp.]|uniref:hypothetical protein n=1 Tax=Mesorhizobium sp. TaxID=1871066 RepID=UPI0025D39D4C